MAYSRANVAFQIRIKCDPTHLVDLGNVGWRGDRNICVPEVSCAGVHWNSVARCGVRWRGLFGRACMEGLGITLLT